MHKNNAHLSQGKAAQVIEVQIRYYSHFCNCISQNFIQFTRGQSENTKSQYFASNANL